MNEMFSFFFFLVVSIVLIKKALRRLFQFADKVHLFMPDAGERVIRPTKN